MKNLQKEYLRVLKLFDKVGIEFLSGNKYKKDREWWLIGSMFKLLRANDKYCDAYALSQESPDFNIKTVMQESEFNIEVCEVLHPGRKRGAEEKKEFDDGFWIKNVEDRKIDIWKTLKSGLQNKLRKDYGNNCWLLIYHNIPMRHISNMGFWANLVCANIKEWIADKSLDLQNCKFENIFIINSGADKLITIYPEFSIVYSEDEQYFYC